MNYEAQLLSIEWKTKRKEIIQRDFCGCLHCGNDKVIKDATKIDQVRIDRYSGNYKFSYFERDCKNVTNIHLAEQFVILNALYSENLKLYLFELYKKNSDGTDVILAVREKDLDIELVLVKTNEILISKRHYPVTISSSEFISLRNSEEERKLKKWLLVPGLNVHHKYYIKGRKAWEYDNEVLVTLCKYCHEELHRNDQVPYYSECGKLIQYFTPCDRCGGHGIIPEFIHVEDGICFKCKGAGYYELT